MAEFEEIPPGTAIIDAIRAERSQFYEWAGEAIDNAFDAQAHNVNLTMGETLSSKDDGQGITKDRDKASVQIAQHGEMDSTRLGRFGVGIKYKAIQHGNIFSIVSISKDGKLTRRIDWARIQKANKWLYPSATRIPSSGHLGTRITIGELTRRPKPTDIERTKQEIQRRYYPALEQGRIITVNEETILPIKRPDMDRMIDVRLKFPEGRTVRVRGGMLLSPASAKLRQVDICVSYRIIRSECGFGCDGYTGIRSMYALIELYGPWKLTKFKDNIADDPYEEDLEKGVQEALRPLLERCEASSMFLKTKKLEQMINELVPEERRSARPNQKQKLGRKGPKRGEKSPKELADATNVPSGPVKKPKKPPGILVEFADGLCEKYGYGRAIREKSETRIQLANDNPHIIQLKTNRDQFNSAIALYAIATLLLFGQEDTSDQLSFPFKTDESFGLQAWRLVNQQGLQEAAE